MKNPFAHLGKLFSKSPAKAVSARYDAAAHTPQAARKWSAADFALPNDALNRDVRLTIKSRARYECENTPWVSGMIRQYAEDLVSTGPRLQIEDGNDIEREWNDWCGAVDLAGKLRLAVETKCRDGEAFLQLTSNPKVANASKLFPLLIDSSRISSPDSSSKDIDGVFIDRFLEPVRYSVAKDLDNIGEGHYFVDAGHMCHYFRRFAPEQQRGVSDIAPALPSIAMLRAYTVATLNKLEASATVIGVLEPDSAVIDPDQVADPPFSTFDMPARSWMTLPSGYKSKQFQCLNPTDSQNAYAEQVKGEVARCLLATKNVVLGDSSSYNYSSARLDMQSYDRAIEVAREELQRAIIDKVFFAWWRERRGNAPLPRYHYYWAQRGYINPSQESQAQTNSMSNGDLTFQRLCAESGQDWQEVMRSRYEAERYRRELDSEYGFSVPMGPAFPDQEP